jgi:hypothetical protein
MVGKGSGVEGRSRSRLREKGGAWERGRRREGSGKWVVEWEKVEKKRGKGEVRGRVGEGRGG